MNNRITFSCTALNGTNKVGELKPNELGYRECVLGALNFANSIGAIYPEAPARELIKPGGLLARRIEDGQCRGEYGHPKPQPGGSREDFLRRLLTIEEKNVSHHHGEIWLDANRVKYNGRPVLAFMGLVKSAGPYGDVLEKQFENPLDNVSFSIRSITNDRLEYGRLMKYLREIVCWDYVNQPGIRPATKFNSPSLESVEVGESLQLGLNDLERIIEHDQNNMIGVGTEAIDILKSVHTNIQRQLRLSGDLPISSRW